MNSRWILLAAVIAMTIDTLRLETCLHSSNVPYVDRGTKSRSLPPSLDTFSPLPRARTIGWQCPYRMSEFHFGSLSIWRLLQHRSRSVRSWPGLSAMSSC